MSESTSEEKVKYYVYLSKGIHDEIAALAKANGVKEAEQLRTCVLEGLRAGQRRVREAKGESQQQD
jgi:hypothetical protein